LGFSCDCSIDFLSVCIGLCSGVFFEGLEKFFKNNFVCVGFASPFPKLWSKLGLVGFGNMLAKWVGYSLGSFFIF
jgi:hypothetical protein